MKLSVISAALILAGLVNFTFAKEPLPLPTDQVGVELAAPPFEGTVSIGVFDSAGQCIRVLYKNTDQEKIPSALNGFLITWDGKTDAGSIAAKGEYEIRGLTVGEVNIEGEAYHFNDWINASPNEIPLKTLRIEFSPEGFRAWQIFADGPRSVNYDSRGNPLAADKEMIPLPTSFQASRGATTLTTPDQKTIYSGPSKIELPELGTILDLAVGKEKAFWVITQATDATQLRQYSLSGEFLRELNPDTGEIFDHVAASENDEKIALISRIGDTERVRLLTQSSTSANNVSLWKTLLEKKIQPCSEFGFDVASGQIVAKGDLPAEKSISISLIENELTPGQKNSIAFTAASLDDGLWLTTKGGLPVVPIATDLTSKRMALAPGKKSDTLLFYANIAGTVAEFSISGLSNIMQFTSEKIQWPPGQRQTADEKDVPTNEPAPTPEN